MHDRYHNLPSLVRSALGPEAVVHADLVAEACSCSSDTPDLYPVLTGIPGFGTAELPNRFVPGPFTFYGKADAEDPTTITISGQNGSWSNTQDNASHIGDPNLTNFMPKDADYSIIATHVRFFVGSITTADSEGAEELASLVGGLRLVTSRNGSLPITVSALGCTDLVGVLQGTTPEITSPGVPREIGMIARRIDIRNDIMQLVIPAAASTPLVGLQVYGYAIANRELVRPEKSYLESAWWGKALSSYPTGVVGPMFARVLQSIGRR